MTNTYLKDNEAKAEYDEGFKDGWNEAIDEAASVIDQLNRDGPYQAIGGAKEIRKLRR